MLTTTTSVGDWAIGLLPLEVGTDFKITQIIKLL